MEHVVGFGLNSHCVCVACEFCVIAGNHKTARKRKRTAGQSKKAKAAQRRKDTSARIREGLGKSFAEVAQNVKDCVHELLSKNIVIEDILRFKKERVDIAKGKQFKTKGKASSAWLFGFTKGLVVRTAERMQPTYSATCVCGDVIPNNTSPSYLIRHAKRCYKAKVFRNLTLHLRDFCDEERAMRLGEQQEESIAKILADDKSLRDSLPGCDSQTAIQGQLLGPGNALAWLPPSSQTEPSQRRIESVQTVPVTAGTPSRSPSAIPGGPGCRIQTCTPSHVRVAAPTPPGLASSTTVGRSMAVTMSLLSFNPNFTLLLTQLSLVKVYLLLCCIVWALHDIVYHVLQKPS